MVFDSLWEANYEIWVFKAVDSPLDCFVVLCVSSVAGWLPRLFTSAQSSRLLKDEGSR